MLANRPFGEVYLHWNTASEKGYVGQTTRGVDARWREHISHAHSVKMSAYHSRLSRAIRKYGPERFETQILATARTREELDNLERIWVILLQTRAHGYNICVGGEGSPGFKHTAEAKEKISAARMGNTHCVGRRISAETRSKIGAGHRGKVVSSETRAKLSIYRTGLKHTPEAKAKMSAYRVGCPWSEARRAACSRERNSVAHRKSHRQAVVRSTKGCLGKVE
jgi:group I intron endonuclease